MACDDLGIVDVQAGELGAFAKEDGEQVIDAEGRRVGKGA